MRGKRLARNLGWVVNALLVVAAAGIVVLGGAAGFALLLPDTVAQRAAIRLDPAGTAAAMMAAAALLAAFVFILFQLRAILGTVAAGAPFASANVGRLRAIAATMAAMFVVQLIAGLAAGTPQAGPGHPTFAPFDGGLFLGVLVVLVLAEVFREGARLATEAEGTI